MFTVEELEEMKSYSVMDFTYKIDDLMNELEPLAEKSMKQKGRQGRYGKESRKILSNIKFICEVTRAKIQRDLGGMKKRDLIQLEIEKAKRRIEHTKNKHAEKIRNLQIARDAKKSKRGS